jgi:hypothetical protein
MICQRTHWLRSGRGEAEDTENGNPDTVTKKKDDSGESAYCRSIVDIDCLRLRVNGQHSDHLSGQRALVGCSGSG